MGLRSVGAVKETATVTFHNPKTRQPLLNGDGSPMTMTFYGPYSKVYKKAMQDRQKAKLSELASKGDLTALTEEDILDGDAEDETNEMMIACAESWNLTVADAPEPFSPEAIRAVFAEFPWARDQAAGMFLSVSAFLDAPAKVSPTTRKKTSR